MGPLMIIKNHYTIYAKSGGEIFFWKSVNICRSYGQLSRWSFYETRCIVYTSYSVRFRDILTSAKNVARIESAPICISRKCMHILIPSRYRVTLVEFSKSSCATYLWCSGSTSRRRCRNFIKTGPTQHASISDNFSEIVVETRAASAIRRF